MHNRNNSPRPPQSGNNHTRREKDTGPKANHAITAKTVRVIDDKGEMRGVMTVREGIALAEEVGLDLVEISPGAEPPVCKIQDYGKYKYELQKKAAEARKNQKVVELKEIKIRPNIDDHDFGIKMKASKAFLGEGDKVKITLRFRGREMANHTQTNLILGRVRTELAEFGKVESEPSMEGRQLIMIIAPVKGI